jgi:hypothetical protein
MSYSVQPPPVAVPPVLSPAGRPPVVTAAAALLWAMAAAGLAYAISTLAIVPGTVDRFRGVATGDEPETYVAVVWLGAAIGLAIAVILVALYVVLGIALRRGSNAGRITTLVVCGLGVLTGAASALIVAGQRSGDSVAGSMGGQLSSAYPDGWIGTNAGLAVAQAIGYAVVGALVLAAPKAFFRRAGASDPAGQQQSAAWLRLAGSGRPAAGLRPAGSGRPAAGLRPAGSGRPAAGIRPPGSGWSAAGLRPAVSGWAGLCAGARPGGLWPASRVWPGAGLRPAALTLSGVPAVVGVRPTGRRLPVCPAAGRLGVCRRVVPVG